MSITQIKKMQRFIEFNGKPFTSLEASSETGLDVLQVRKVIHDLLKMDYIKIVSKSKGWHFYAKNKNYVNPNPKNGYGYEISIINKLTKLMKRKEYSSQDELASDSELTRYTVNKYLVAMASIGMVTIENKLYVLKEMKEHRLIGKDIDSKILTKLGKSHHK